MTLRRIKLSAVAVILFILFLGPGVAQPTVVELSQSALWKTVGIGWGAGSTVGTRTTLAAGPVDWILLHLPPVRRVYCPEWL